MKNKYQEFNNSIINDKICIPNNITSYIPQGICEVEDYLLITAYDEKHIRNSIIYLMTKKGKYLKRILLDNKSHCGGISYHKTSKKVFLTGTGGEISYINIYSLESIINYQEETKLKPLKKIKVDKDNLLRSRATRNIYGKELSSPAYLTVYKDTLYVGNFHNKKGIIKKYSLDQDGNIMDEQLINNPYPYTQGLCIYEYQKEEYYLFSSSYGYRNNSTLYICKMTKDNKLLNIGKITMPPLSEQISVCDNNIAIIFESSSNKYYFKVNNPINNICILSFSKLLNSNNLK